MKLTPKIKPLVIMKDIELYQAYIGRIFQV